MHNFHRKGRSFADQKTEALATNFSKATIGYSKYSCRAGQFVDHGHLANNGTGEGIFDLVLANANFCLPHH